jgi:hypothetical protein
MPVIAKDHAVRPAAGILTPFGSVTRGLLRSEIRTAEPKNTQATNFSKIEVSNMFQVWRDPDMADLVLKLRRVLSSQRWEASLCRGRLSTFTPQLGVLLHDPDKVNHAMPHGGSLMSRKSDAMAAVIIRSRENQGFCRSGPQASPTISGLACLIRISDHWRRLWRIG